MRKLLFIALTTLLLATSMITPETHSSLAKTQKNHFNGFAYSTITSEKIDNIQVRDFKQNDEYVSFTIEGKEIIEVHASFIEKEVYDDSIVSVYKNQEDDYHFVIYVTEDYVSGSAKLHKSSLNDKFELGYNHFGFLFTLNDELSIDEEVFFTSLLEDKEVKAQVEKNINMKKSAEEYYNSPNTNNDPASFRTANVNAQTGTVSAEATIWYDFRHAGHYNVYILDRIQYKTTKTSFNSAYIHIYEYDDRPWIWSNSVDNRMTTENLSIIIYSNRGRGALVSYVSRWRIIPIINLKIPVIVDDWDLFYFH